jgi:hypothetical protein
VTKAIEESFADWEGSAFGFGYGSGEPHTLGALKDFFAALKADGRSYEYEKLEAVLGARVAWLLINVLCRHPGILEYGTSPRYGWLTKQGERLKAFVDGKTVDELVALCQRSEDATSCYPNACNCGPSGGYEEGRRCPNPFWCA